MKNNLLIILIFISGLLQAQGAPQSYSFSLDQAISHALSHNYSAINATRDIAMAKKKKWETTTIGLPQINASLGYQNNIELQKSLIVAKQAPTIPPALPSWQKESVGKDIPLK